MAARNPARAVTVAVLAALTLTVAEAVAFDESQYPDWSGQWKRPRGVGAQWDPTKPPGLGQQAPLTPEYQAILEASIKDQAAGGQGTDGHVTCVTNGMPRMMTVTFPIEFVITPKVTYVHFEPFMPRRIYTDGRDLRRRTRAGVCGLFRSAAGSIPTATALRHARSRDPQFQGPAHLRA